MSFTSTIIVSKIIKKINKSFQVSLFVLFDETQFFIKTKYVLYMNRFVCVYTYIYIHKIFEMT